LLRQLWHRDELVKSEREEELSGTGGRRHSVRDVMNQQNVSLNSFYKVWEDLDDNQELGKITRADLDILKDLFQAYSTPTFAD
jgi:hypothetical protein